jgi:hypothetical protein
VILRICLDRLHRHPCEMNGMAMAELAEVIADWEMKQEAN